MASRVPSDTDLRAWRALMRVYSDVVDHLEADLTEAERLPLAWYEVLVNLRLAGGAMRMHELAEHLTLSRSAATRFVDRVEEAGFVERAICPTDRRGMLVTLTDAGRKAQERAAPITLRGIQKNFGNHLTAEQAEAVADALETVLQGQGKAISANTER